METSIRSIATSVPEFCHNQHDILQFMQHCYQLEAAEQRKLRFLYQQSGIDQRFSVLPDFASKGTPMLFATEDISATPLLEQRMLIYHQSSLDLTTRAILQCIDGYITPDAITHLITVSCTGMSAPGLDLQLMETLGLAPDIFRTSVNFMGCYAAVHALKLAKMIGDTSPSANIVVVCVELCTLHFQQEFTADNAASSLLFADGCAAVLLSNDPSEKPAILLDHFYAYVAQKGKSDMAWHLASNGFQMKLSGYIPQLIEEDIATLVSNAASNSQIQMQDITHWCVHPGGKRILDVIEKQLALQPNALDYSRQVLRKYGNMSSPTILFVLKAMMEAPDQKQGTILGVAFGPGLTMETFTAHFI